MIIVRRPRYALIMTAEGKHARKEEDRAYTAITVDPGYRRERATPLPRNDRGHRRRTETGAVEHAGQMATLSAVVFGP